MLLFHWPAWAGFELGWCFLEAGEATAFLIVERVKLMTWEIQV